MLSVNIWYSFFKQGLLCRLRETAYVEVWLFPICSLWFISQQFVLELQSLKCCFKLSISDYILFCIFKVSVVSIFMLFYKNNSFAITCDPKKQSCLMVFKCITVNCRFDCLHTSFFVSSISRVFFYCLQVKELGKLWVKSYFGSCK